MRRHLFLDVVEVITVSFIDASEQSKEDLAAKLEELGVCHCGVHRPMSWYEIA